MNNNSKHTTMFFAHFKSGKSESSRQEIFDEYKTLHEFFEWIKKIKNEIEAKYKQDYVITNCNIFRDE